LSLVAFQFGFYLVKSQAWDQDPSSIEVSLREVGFYSCVANTFEVAPACKNVLLDN